MANSKVKAEKGISAGYVSEKEEEDKKIDKHLKTSVKQQHEVPKMTTEEAVEVADQIKALDIAKKEAAEILQDAAPISIRPTLASFVVEMELVLRLHDSRKGKDSWLDTHPLVLIAKLTEEVGELSVAVLNTKSPQEIKREAADVGNLAFMIAHKSGNL